MDSLTNYHDTSVFDLQFAHHISVQYSFVEMKRNFDKMNELQCFTS